MLNYLWAGMTLTGILWGALHGQMTAVTDGAIQASKEAVSRIHPAVSQSRFTVMCDVTNPLTGPDGATYTFGKQKGGTPEILDVLEGGMIRYAALLKEKLGVDVDKIPGPHLHFGIRSGGTYVNPRSYVSP